MITFKTKNDSLKDSKSCWIKKKSIYLTLRIGKDCLWKGLLCLYSIQKTCWQEATPPWLHFGEYYWRPNGVSFSYATWCNNITVKGCNIMKAFKPRPGITKICLMIVSIICNSHDWKCPEMYRMFWRLQAELSVLKIKVKYLEEYKDKRDCFCYVDEIFLISWFELFGQLFLKQ